MELFALTEMSAKKMAGNAKLPSAEISLVLTSKHLILIYDAFNNSES